MSDKLEDFAKSGILPMEISETGADHEPLEEVIICDAISGGARYKNNMPKELYLTRKLKDGTEYRARYIQSLVIVE